MKVVLDTNVLISGTLWKGAPSALLYLAEQGAFRVCLTPLLLQEVERVLQYQKLAIPLLRVEKNVRVIVDSLARTSLILQDRDIPQVVRDDPTDNVVLGAALCHQADYVISGDQHLLKLKEFAGIPILAPRAFLDRLKK